MEEIKINDYIKTKSGNIYKVRSITKFSDGDIHIAVKEQTIFLRPNEIAKHSKNIIDLIEIGDYVNEEKVIALRGEDDCYYDVGTDFDDEYGNWFGYQKEEIRTILTKEQYKNNCFEVEEGQDV